MSAGTVILVGAGPGDLGLLTLDGKHAIMHADVLIFDRLVRQDILALAPRHATLVNVGKQSGYHPVNQEQINELLVLHAQSGARVVRLKGGDGYLFGRGGEEAQALHDAGIPFRVIPGISSALAAPAYAGIPVTHRDFASSVHIITAKGKRDSSYTLDFDTLVKLEGTLVFLMGIAALPELMQGLLSAGMDGAMPAAVVENGTTATQRKVVASVATLADCARVQHIQSPAVIVVGRVCSLSSTLDWYTQLPLHSIRVLVTRPASRASSLSQQLRLRGADVISMPCIETTIREDARLPENLHVFTWVVLTSPFGVQAMHSTLIRENMDLRALSHCKFACIGDATARALRDYGICADFIPDSFTSEALAYGLCERIASTQQVLLLRAEQGSEVLPEILKQHAISFVDVKTYVTEFTENATASSVASMLSEGCMDYITFTSASTVKSFVSQMPYETYQGKRAVCIGDITAQEARKHGFSVIIAEKATIESMVACIEKESCICKSK